MPLARKKPPPFGGGWWPRLSPWPASPPFCRLVPFRGGLVLKHLPPTASAFAFGLIPSATVVTVGGVAAPVTGAAHYKVEAVNHDVEILQRKIPQCLLTAPDIGEHHCADAIRSVPLLLILDLAVKVIKHVFCFVEGGKPPDRPCRSSGRKAPDSIWDFLPQMRH